MCVCVLPLAELGALLAYRSVKNREFTSVLFPSPLSPEEI